MKQITLVDPRRTRSLNDKEYRSGSVLYWMSRDQRVQDNWALLFAQEQAKELGVSWGVVFCLQPSFLGATGRQYQFMLAGLQRVELELTKLGTKFSLVIGDPVAELSKYCAQQQVGLVVTDFSPLKLGRSWRDSYAHQTTLPVIEVDAHNLVPVWMASDKQEYAARTIRPKINKALDHYLTEFLPVQPQPSVQLATVNWAKIEKSLAVDQTLPPVTWIKPGAVAAQATLAEFTNQGLSKYDKGRNDPTVDATSGLSIYLHFGQLAAQRVALAVTQSKRAKTVAAKAFLEQLIIRKELADNFCFYNPNYDQVKGFPAWARQSLAEHLHDDRPYLYTKSQLEQAKTHDQLWNAAQIQLTKTGWMHGYMRMYWAKKILEWSRTPQQALRTAIELNDRYQLDGRDPNGYVGIAWSIGGLHDKPWFDRKIFGMVRYMSATGLEKKFDTQTYIRQWLG